MIKPIPKRLLPNSCIYKKYLGNTGEGDEWGDDTPLTYVKIEEKMQLKVTSISSFSPGPTCHLVSIVVWKQHTL